ncbi:MAG TPA: N-acetylmuramoyl-L-alanine amidase [Nakamurella sp.]
MGIAAAATLLLVSCAAPDQTAEPPSTSFSPTSSAAASASPVTVPGLTTPSSESPTPAPTPEPSTSSAEPTPEQTTEALDLPDDDYTESEPAQPEPQEPAQTADPAPEQQPAATGGGRVVVIDPGHNGANAANPGTINALVDAGFGQTKPCNTTGTSTNAGYTEHEFTWGVSTRLQSILQARGYDVRMTRTSDDGVGPCVNKRAAFGNDANAAAVVSVHGDGDDAGAQGFYVMTAERAPAGAPMAGKSDALASTMRDALVNGGLSPSNHLGSAGLWKRGDLAGLNLSTRPTVMVEMGNMRNSSDAALMSSSTGQQQMAQGIADGVSAYLGAG